MKKHTGFKVLETMEKADWYNNWIIKKIQQHVRGDILEVGFGLGSFTQKLSRKGNVCAIDINEKYLKSKKRTEIQHGFGDIERGKYFFGKKKFDTIICMNVLEHIKNDKKALQNTLKLLKANGILVLLVPAHRILFSNVDKNLGHYRRYSKKQLGEHLEKVGFSVIKCRYINWWGAIGWYLFVKLSKGKILPVGKVKIFDVFAKILLWPEKFIEPPFGISVLVVAKKNI
jgi:2-polyprenyl-3-methyl-5-hydroxy-6-metoxy-1,4-benzoquinol methylase